MGLTEDHLALRPVQGTPLADAPLERPADAGPELGMPAQQLLEKGDGSQAGVGLQHRRDLGVEDLGQRIRPSAPTGRVLLGGWPRVVGKAVAGRGAEPRARRGNRDRVGQAVLHEEPQLVVGHMAAGQGASPARESP
jgi:hypothetical protein